MKLRVGAAISAAATLFALWTLWGAGFAATGWSCVLLASGVPVFLLVRRAARLSAPVPFHAVVP